MFDKDYSFKGKHADMVNELTASYNETGLKLFSRNLDVYLTAPIVGFLYQRKSPVDLSSKTTNILLDAIFRETTTLWFNYRLIMLLDTTIDSDFSARVDKAFRHYNTERAKGDEELYESYVRGGVEILHEKLMQNISSTDDYLKNMYEFLEEFEELYGQNTDDILDLVQLAKR